MCVFYYSIFFHRIEILYKRCSPDHIVLTAKCRSIIFTKSLSEPDPKYFYQIRRLIRAKKP